MHVKKIPDKTSVIIGIICKDYSYIHGSTHVNNLMGLPEEIPWALTCRDQSSRVKASPRDDLIWKDHK